MAIFSISIPTNPHREALAEATASAERQRERWHRVSDGTPYAAWCRWRYERANKARSKQFSRSSAYNDRLQQLRKAGHELVDLTLWGPPVLPTLVVPMGDGALAKEAFEQLSDLKRCLTRNEVKVPTVFTELEELIVEVLVRADEDYTAGHPRPSDAMARLHARVLDVSHEYGSLADKVVVRGSRGKIELESTIAMASGLAEAASIRNRMLTELSE